MRASINGSEVFYEVLGEGVPMLLLHGGMGLDHTYFRPWLDRLGDAAQLVFFDHRGNGRSAQPEDWSAVDHQTWVRDADALREHLGHEKIFLLGHSYGGFLAQEYALHYREHLRGMILCNTAPAFDYADVALSNAQVRGAREQLQALERALSTRAPDDETAGQWWRELFPLYFHRPDAAVLQAAAGRIRYSAGAWNRSVFELMPAFDLTDRISDIQVPALVLAGREDWIMPPEQGAERLHAMLPKSELVVFEESGHFPWIEQPDAFVHSVEGWLHRHGLPCKH